MSELDLDVLRRHIADGLVKEQRHPRLPLSIYNYSPRVQYEKLWDDVTKRTRGIVMHGEQIIARPFAKFFNDTEHDPAEIPWHLPCDVTEKLDGSLLIWFCFEGQWIAATRGSFMSEQSQVGAKIIQEQYPNFPFNPEITFLFEVLYPANRIVVNYGGRREVVLLAAIATATGNEISLDDIEKSGLKTVRRLPPDASVKELRTIIRDEEEGYVVRFENGFRMKVKGERYMELHRIITGLSSRTIWENLSQGVSLDRLLEVAPDECGDWIHKERAMQQAGFTGLKVRTQMAFKEVSSMQDRKTQALHLMANYRDVSSAVFSALDGRSYDEILWKKLYPEFRRPDIAERIEV